MVITVKCALTFTLYNYFTVRDGNGCNAQQRSLLLASASAISGSNQVVPDWVYFDQLFLAAIASGKATIVTAPTGCVTLNAGATSASVELPTVAGAQNVVVMNTLTDPDNQSDVFVLLGDSSIEVTPQTGINIPAGSSIMIPLNGNTYIAAIGASVPNNVCQIAVI